MKGTEMKKLQVWWIPQVPMKAFKVPVTSIAEGIKILDTLAFYDIFLFKNNIKPDYCNAGGLQEWVEDAGEGEPGWVDWYDEETGCDDPAEYPDLTPPCDRECCGAEEEGSRYPQDSSSVSRNVPDEDGAL